MGFIEEFIYSIRCYRKVNESARGLINLSLDISQFPHYYFAYISITTQKFFFLSHVVSWLARLLRLDEYFLHSVLNKFFQLCKDSIISIIHGLVSNGTSKVGSVKIARASSSIRALNERLVTQCAGVTCVAALITCCSSRDATFYLLLPTHCRRFFKRSIDEPSYSWLGMKFHCCHIGQYVSTNDPESLENK